MIIHETAGGATVVWVRKPMTHKSRVFDLFKILARPAFSGPLGDGIWFCHGCMAHGRNADSEEANRHAAGCDDRPRPTPTP